MIDLERELANISSDQLFHVLEGKRNDSGGITYGKPVLAKLVRIPGGADPVRPGRLGHNYHFQVSTGRLLAQSFLSSDYKGSGWFETDLGHVVIIKEMMRQAQEEASKEEPVAATVVKPLIDADRAQILLLCEKGLDPKATKAVMAETLRDIQAILDRD